MTTATQHQQHQPSQPQFGFVVDTYDPDEVVPRGSPLMAPLRPKLEPSPSPPPDIPPAQVRPTSGDAVLVAYLGNGRDPDVARLAGSEGLAAPDEESFDEESRQTRPVDDSTMNRPSLAHLAADALQAASLVPISPSAPRSIADITGQLSIHDESPAGGTHAAYVSVPRVTSPHHNSSGPLPPLHGGYVSPGESKESLPSLRSALGEIRDLGPGRIPEKDLAAPSGPSTSFPASSPGGNFARFSLSTNLPSSPVSPDGHRTLSPHSTGPSGIHFHAANNTHPRPGTDYSSSSNAGETPSTDHSVSTPATSTSITDRMSIDGITNPQPPTGTGAYVCNFAGCTALPFQTQYLLNSHANVHSSARPHYCPVKGCPRSEGGKGFKRKNEMIRHGLVHDSPGYVCPFCPDREHKYPRPDNLQRHVRVHHVDKDKDDPLLRDVLAQRPDGPNRGRRRRGPPS
ncbi:hypothetical protein BHE90_011748 [Fusarium euwallaceae]|uniref:C2H2-type domain-containing protein n=3 Tax=Fusarium solani species complex TaxID=232080 RepID=A0A428TKB7_9HYPO|nr:hypothetical protein CEP51_008037 [Fusarium floridanum]RSM02452.1 hypothetical protein CEP52_007920 [Fusarium oligoseptatum]RTE73824.1 hypothetical protein BHE90_011748 [Fusarium euwallaceae]